MFRPGHGDETILGKCQLFQIGLAAGQSRLPSSGAGTDVHPAQALSRGRRARFTCILRFSAERAAKEGWILSNRNWFSNDPSHRNRDARIIGRIHVRDGHDGGKSRNAAR
ncbi:hypothetical protein I6F16_02270 [Bradyrhizobium sp. IC4060]|nr:hypothetical protein [Bradyrhizobium sp. IC4060]MCA1482469.1 hypothetical protein [Bradyrhizobium sp. IC4061]